MVLFLAGCGDDASTPAAVSTQETQPPPGMPATQPPPSVSPPSASLSTDLVGRWTTEHWLDQSGSQKIVRTFVFAPDGSYQYTIATCRSGDCVLNGQESGSVQAADGMLSLTPETGSQDGPRGWRYVVGRSEVGDVQLHLALPDGQTDIFYYG